MKRGRKKKDSYLDKSKYEGQTKEVKDKMDAIEKILALYPDLKKDKTNIITTVLGQKKNNDGDIKEKVVVEFTHNNKTYFKSKLGEIFDENINLVGTWKNNYNNTIEYLFYDETKFDFLEKETESFTF